jgi:hypothetical protein
MMSSTNMSKSRPAYQQNPYTYQTDVHCAMKTSQQGWKAGSSTFSQKAALITTDLTFNLSMPAPAILTV